MTTKHLSYTRRRGCLETLSVVKLAHMVPSRFDTFLSNFTIHLSPAVRITLSSLFGFPSLSLINATLEHMCTRGKSSGKNQIELTSFISDNFQKRWFSVQITPDRIASVVFGAFEEYSRWESWWGAGLQLPSIKYVYIWTVNQRWQLSKQNENFGANIKGMASYC